MNRMEELFSRQEMDHPLSEGFEERVFSRIESCRRRRRVTVTTIVVSAALGFVFALALSLPHSSTQPVLQANRSPITTSSKEVIPVVEDVMFSTYDGQTHYAVEQVSLEEEAEF
ncbi:MAG TPA: hypothetical protein ENN40_08230 [Candidatus Aminicenantes bacterium]|nr:hypothetical protein [Candidatus Aminicenantes bacterium]